MEEAPCCSLTRPEDSENAAAMPVEIADPTAATVLQPTLAEHGDTIEIGGPRAYTVYDMKNLGKVDDHNMFMHLQRAVGIVMGVKEAMWDELKIMVDRRDDRLSKYGWKFDSIDFTPAESRKRFEWLWDRYREYVSDP